MKGKPAPNIPAIHPCYKMLDSKCQIRQWGDSEFICDRTASYCIWREEPKKEQEKT